MSRYAAQVDDDDDDPPMMDPSSLVSLSMSQPQGGPEIGRPTDKAGLQQLAEQMRAMAATGMNVVVGDGDEAEDDEDEDGNRIGRWVRLFPVYFDRTRTRAQGRRVGRNVSVDSPLAGTVAGACRSIGLKVKVNVGKTHPRDWANPGLVLVWLPLPAHRESGPEVKNKHHLFNLVATELGKKPTTSSDSINFAAAAGMLMDSGDTKTAPVGVPRGWKISPILPVHSPAVGDGVNDGIMRDMIAGMAAGVGNQAGGNGIPGLAGLANMFGSAGGAPGLTGGLAALAGMDGSGAGAGQQGAPQVKRKRVVVRK